MRNRRRLVLAGLLAVMCTLNWVLPAVADEPAACEASCLGSPKVSCSCTGGGAECSSVDQTKDTRGGCRAYDNNGCIKIEDCPPLMD